MRRRLLAAALLGLAGPALAAESGQIRVIGRAQAEARPDFAAVEVGVETRGGTATAALDAASAAARVLIAAARELGVPEADIGTAALTMRPLTRPVRQADGSTREQPDGYAAGNRVQIRLGDMARLGELLRRAAEGGSNRIDGISFGLRDPAQAQAAVQVAAMRDARAQAERLAEAAGLRLGPALSIAAPPRQDGPPPMPFAAAKAARAREAVPVEAGTLTMSAEVEATFAILP